MKNETDTFPITVVKLNQHRDAVAICRGTTLGNPFNMFNDEKNRNKVCDQYEEYFNKKVADNDLIFTTELARLTQLTIEKGYIKLGCFCTPKRCHGDTIKKFLDSVLNPSQEGKLS